MTTPKRRIPINNHEPPAGQAGADTSDKAGATGAASPQPEPRPTESAAANAATAPGAAPAAANEDHTAALDEVTQERDSLADSLLRLRAEFDNYRRRAAKELVEARERSQGELLKDLLPVLDNLERALDAAEHHDESKVLGGVRMTRDMFVALLKGAGVEEIETVGTTFDPQVHDAMVMQPSKEDEGTVTAVLERGYRQGERILRPAKVAVSAGPTGGER